MRIITILFAAISLSLSANANIEGIIKEHGDINIGIMVKNLDNGEVIYEKHQRRTFIPASVTKLFTSYAALHYLGENYKFATTLYLDNQDVTSSNLNSNIYLKFSGDPSLTLNDLNQIFSKLKKLDVKSISGNIIIDDTIFPKTDIAAGVYSQKDEIFCYTAPKSAVVVNNNCASGTIAPTSNKITNLKFDNSAIKITNEITTAKKGQNCPFEAEYLGDNQFRLYGCMLAGSDPENLYFALPDNKKMIVDYIEQVLATNNLKLAGNIVFGEANGSEFYQHQSKPLLDLLKPTLHDSNNLYAENIFRSIGSKYGNGSANSGNAVNAIYALLKEKNIEFANELELHEGAGLSLHNLVSPNVLVELLSTIYNDKPIFAELLPQFAKDGTLENRSCSKIHDLYLVAKTGTLTHTSTLAGYYLPPTGTKFAFAIMTSGFIVDKEEIKRMEEKILATLLK